MYIRALCPERRHLGHRRSPPQAHRYSPNVTSYPSPLDPAAAVELDAVREAILSVVGPSLVGLYLFGPWRGRVPYVRMAGVCDLVDLPRAPDDQVWPPPVEA
jgi:hypothetical protein